MRKGTIFITGITASGKSTLGKRLKEDLGEIGIDNIKLLDCEKLRKQLARQGKCYGYSTDERGNIIGKGLIVFYVPFAIKKI